MNKFIIIYFIIFLELHLFSIDYGIDVLAKNDYNILNGKKVGLLANKASIDKYRNNIIDLFINSPKVNLIRIFSPEHGFLLNFAAGDNVIENNYKNIDVVSLYGKNESLTSLEFDEIEVLVVDIQDVGSTYYTYLSTLTYMMEAAAENDIQIVVLDRPNPLGRNIFGPIKDEAYSNFIGLHPIPIRHGMTIGELSFMINGEGWLKDGRKVDLKIIEMNKFPSDISEFNYWDPPSPNISDIETAFLYNGVCLFEGTNISEGRGTNYPFKIIGAPWIDSNHLMEYISKLNNEKFDSNIKVEQLSFVPKSIKSKALNPKYNNQLCNGIMFSLHKSVEPIEFTLYLLDYFYHQYPDSFIFKDDFFDILYGRSDLRLCLQQKCNIEIFIENSFSQDIIDFTRDRKKYLLY